MATDKYPLAVWKGDGKSGGSYTSGPWKVVLHTTETAGLPGYNGGYSAPHITYIPATREWVQHTSFLTAARALRNGPDPIQTNRDSAIQVEIVCYSAKDIADSSASRIWVGELADYQLDDLRAFLMWVYREFGVVEKWPGVQAYSYAEANASGFRMPMDEWDEWDGVCGHQHVGDGNTHWDPGALNWDYLISDDGEEEMIVKPGDDGKLVGRIQKFLYWSGTVELLWPDKYKLKAQPGDKPIWNDGDFGPNTEAAVRSYQERRGFEVNGWVDSWLYGDLTVWQAQTNAIANANRAVDAHVEELHGGE